MRIGENIIWKENFATLSINFHEGERRKKRKGNLRKQGGRDYENARNVQGQINIQKVEFKGKPDRDSKEGSSLEVSEILLQEARGLGRKGETLQRIL